MPELGKRSLAGGVRGIHRGPSSRTASPTICCRGSVGSGGVREPAEEMESQGPGNTPALRSLGGAGLFDLLPFPILKAQSG